MSLSDDSYYQESQFTKIFEGIGSIGSIYVTSTPYARDLSLLREKEIQAVLTVEKQQKINLPVRQIPSYLYLQIEDDIDFNIASFFEEACKFIEQNRRITNILIHCSSGTNCSIAIVLAYLIKKYKYTYAEALTILKKRFRNFNGQHFNAGFVHRLQYFAVQKINFFSLPLVIKIIKNHCSKEIDRKNIIFYLPLQLYQWNSVVSAFCYFRWIDNLRQKGDFKLVRDNYFKKKLERVRRTFDGIVRIYSKERTTEQKLMGCKSPSKYVGKGSKSLISSKRKFQQQSFLPSQSTLKINPEEAFHSRRSKQYERFLPKKSKEEIQDEEHHKKIVSEIFDLSKKSNLYQSRRVESIYSDANVMKNYERLTNSKKKHRIFYSPLKKYQKYEMFTQTKLNQQFELSLDKI